VRVGRPRLGIVSPFPPRQSGLAGYGAQLVAALAAEVDVVVCAVDRHGLNYPDEVVAVIGPDDPDDYRRAARILVEHRVDVVLIEHDTDVYAGPGGAHVLDLIHELRRRDIPYLVTLHGVHRRAGSTSASPGRSTSAGSTSASPGRSTSVGTDALAVLAQGAARVMVTSHDARRRLAAWGIVAADRVRVVPLGVTPTGPPPDPDKDPTAVRPALLDALAGAGPVLSTFGLVEPGKGVETALAALPIIAARCPDVRYVLAGTTGGGAYGDELRSLVAERGLDGLVHFVDAYLNPTEIAALFERTDVYLAPGLPAERTASGSLTQAVAAGCVTVAGAHPYARELLGGQPVGAAGPSGRSHRRGRPARLHRSAAGMIVPAGDSRALAAAVVGLLTNPARAAELRESALVVGRRHHWDGVARQVAGLVREAGRSRSRVPTGSRFSLPELRLDVLMRNPSGPFVDSSTTGGSPAGWHARRACVAADLLGLPAGALPPDGWTAAADWVERSIRALGAAPDEDTGPALWGLGRVAGGPGVPEPLREEAEQLRRARLHDLPTEPLAAAFAALGLVRGSSRDPALATVAARLDAALLRASHGAEWPWFTTRLGADAARLPQALIAAGRRLRDPAMVRRGLGSLDWYARRVGLAGADGVLRLPTGPTELAGDAGAVVEALVEAYRATGSGSYARLARRSFDWFLGANRHAEPVYDQEQGRCRPGVAADPGDRTRDGLGTVTTMNRDRADDGTGTLAYLGATLALVTADLADLPAAHRDLAPA
jgi:glycosyltransferase involved in cell wall biosynthesis